MNYKQIQPAGILKPYIRYFGLLENDGLVDQTKTFKIIADEVEEIFQVCGNHGPGKP